jgi:HEAT repeat protein
MIKLKRRRKEKVRPKRKRSFGPRLDPLINALHSKDGEERRQGRLSLVSVGPEALEPLIEMLNDPDHEVRWEAAKALGEIADPWSAPALVEILGDADFDIRWLAAEGLIALGKAGLEPILEALVNKSDSVYLREGAHHVMYDLAHKGFRDQLAPVMAALDGVDPEIEVREPARKALHQLRG